MNVTHKIDGGKLKHEIIQEEEKESMLNEVDSVLMSSFVKQFEDIKKELAELREKAGREISAKNMKMLTAVADSMEKATTEVRILIEANTIEEGKSKDGDSLDVEGLLKDVDIDKKEEDVTLTKEDQLKVLEGIDMNELSKVVMDKRMGKVS